MSRVVLTFRVLFLAPLPLEFAEILPCHVPSDSLSSFPQRPSCSDPGYLDLPSPLSMHRSTVCFCLRLPSCANVSVGDNPRCLRRRFSFCHSSSFTSTFRLLAVALPYLPALLFHHFKYQPGEGTFFYFASYEPVLCPSIRFWALPLTVPPCQSHDRG